MLLTRDQLLKPLLPITQHEIPELGGKVNLRPMTAAERDDYDAEQYRLKQSGDEDETPQLANFRARMCVRCIVDTDGNRLLQDEDAAALGGQSGAIVNRIFDVIKTINGLDEATSEADAKN